jgi:hypothetical protein
MTNSGGRFFVGNIGSTGTATGPHIHKYVKDLKTGSYIDPSTIKSALTGIQIGEKRTPLVRRTSTGGFEWNPDTGLVITSRFGKRTAPTAGASTDHKGIDFAGAAGTPIYFQGYGKALPVPSAGGYGNLMTFRTADNKYELGFGHMNKLGPEAQVYASNLNTKPAAPVLPTSDFTVYNQGQQAGQGIGALATLGLVSKLLGDAKNSRSSSSSLYSSLMESILKPERNTTTDFLMNYMMNNPYEV